MRLDRSKRMLLLILMALSVVAAPAEAFTQPPQPSSQDGFVPADQLPADEKLPAAPLLIAAYAVAWVVVLVYLWSIWQRLSRVERELADVGRRIDTGTRR